MGVTGAREQTSTAGPELVARTRTTTDLPIGIGLGVRDGAQAAAVGAYADAVIVGSALVSCLLDNAAADRGPRRSHVVDQRAGGGRSVQPRLIA